MSTTSAPPSTEPVPSSPAGAMQASCFADVLALLTMDPQDGALVEAAVAIADGMPARAILPVGLPDRVRCPWGVSPQNALLADHRARREDASAHLAMLRRTATRCGGIVDCLALEHANHGLIGSILSVARTARLLVLGVPADIGRTLTPDRRFTDALVATGRPLLVLPRKANLVTRPRRVLVAWRDGPASSRAVHEALPWLRSAHAVRVVTVLGPSLSQAERESAAGEARLRGHLARHGVTATVACVDAQNRPPEHALMDEAGAMGADLIVTGAYGHPRALEFVFGGTTINLLSRCRLPILMAH